MLALFLRFSRFLNSDSCCQLETVVSLKLIFKPKFYRFAVVKHLKVFCLADSPNLILAEWLTFCKLHPSFAQTFFCCHVIFSRISTYTHLRSHNLHISGVYILYMYVTTRYVHTFRWNGGNNQKKRGAAI